MATKVCHNCSSNRDLEVHHKEQNLKVTHRIWSYSEAKRDLELSKCIILCFDCHKKETALQRAKVNPCGTTAKYSSGCRCGSCKYAFQYRRKQLRQMKKEIN